MQPLTAPPRDHLTEDEVIDLITRTDVTISAGLELLDSANRFVEDISDDLVGGSVTHDGRAVVHGACSLQIQRALAWGRDRLRPYLTFSDRPLSEDAVVQARFNQGVYVLTTPTTKRGETPATYDVKGYDLLHPLLKSPGDTFVVLPEEGDDLVTDPGFESGISEWDSNAAFGVFTPATLAWSTSHPAGGTHSLEVTWPTSTQSWANALTNSFIVGKTYRFEADAWVPLDGPDAFRFEIVFQAISPWFTPTKGASNHFEWLWTATSSAGFYGLTAKDTVSGTKTWVDNFSLIPLSTTCLDAVRAALEIASPGAVLLVDGTQEPAVLDGPMVWALTDGNQDSWLDIVNDLLAAIAYVEVYVDQDGNYRTEPFVDPKDLPVEWEHDTDDEKTSLVATERTSDQDVWGKPNRWKFVRRGMATTPVEGDGIYTVDNLDRGPTSQQSLGQVVPTTVFLDAVDQASLEAQGDRIVIEDTSAARTETLMIDPLPIAGHLDVVRYKDGDVSLKAVVISWQTNLDGSAGQHVLEVVD